jgi:hypothetical protein
MIQARNNYSKIISKTERSEGVLIHGLGCRSDKGLIGFPSLTQISFRPKYQTGYGVLPISCSKCKMALILRVYLAPTLLLLPWLKLYENIPSLSHALLWFGA